MSYILDALKKAEQERGNAQLQTIASGRTDRKVDRTRWLPAAVAVILCLSGIICFLLFYQGQKSEMPAAAKKQETKANVGDAPKAITPAEDVRPERNPSIVLPAPEPAPESVSAKQPLIGSRTIAPKQAEAENRIAPAAQTGAPPAPAPSNPDSTQISLRDAAAKMRVTMLMYSDVPSERIVFIDSKKYKEGEYVQGRFLLETIALEGVQLSYKGERVFLHP
jgi:type IV secretory pathway VirB10-like protein